MLSRVLRHFPPLSCHRLFASAAFNRESQNLFAVLTRRFEKVEDSLDGCDLISAMGGISLKTPKGEFLVNTQPFLEEVWLSSPVSGPTHYRLSPSLEWETPDGRRIAEVVGGDVSSLLSLNV